MLELELMTRNDKVVSETSCYPAQSCSPEDAICNPTVPTCVPGCSPR